MADATVKVTTTTEITHISSGAALSAGTFSGTADVSATPLVGTGNLGKYPRADLVLTVTPSTTTTSASMNIYCYRRDLNVGSSSGDDAAPATNNKQKFVGSFQLPQTTSGTYTMTLLDVPLPSPGDCEFYVESGISNGINAGWTLKVTPKSDVGATA